MEEPFGSYLARTRAIIEHHLAELPARMQPLVPAIFEELLPSYGTINGIGTALKRMSRRVTRSNPLAGGEAELRRHYDELRADFSVFLPLARRFAEIAITGESTELRHNLK